MVKKIDFVHYRKFSSNNQFHFIPNINVISGTNGTCKTSLLHLISNSYQRITTKDQRFPPRYIESFNKLTDGLNLKVEALTKGDQKYIDPAIGTTGVLYTVEYYQNNYKLNYRRHNSDIEGKKHRFSLKPDYTQKGQSLPHRPVIYLGLSRLYPYGEYHLDSEKKNYSILSQFQEIYTKIWDDLNQQYYNCLRLKVDNTDDKSTSEELTGIRKRAAFKTDSEGVDSNTISSGQDNVYVILNALACLRFYYEGFLDKENTKEIESVLLIDEFDATLHPEIQVKMYEILKEYSLKYKIQIIFTTHSLSLLEVLLKDKLTNVLYLIDEGNKVDLLSDISQDQLKMYLNNKLRKDLLNDKKIPIYTEDDEARLFIKAIFNEYKSRKQDLDITNIIDSFYLVNVNLGEGNLRGLFSDNFSSSLSKTAIAILDGDQTISDIDKKNNILALPRVDKSLAKNNTPERILIFFAFELFNNSDEHQKFWKSDALRQSGYIKAYVESNILPDFNGFITFDDAPNESTESQKGERRDRAKKLFQTHREFLEYVLLYWVKHEKNQPAIYVFLKNLNIAFKKIAPLYDRYIHHWDMNNINGQTQM